MTRRAILHLAALILACAAPAMGQGGASSSSPASADTTRSGTEAPRDSTPALDLRGRVLQKLRALEAASRPVSARIDSVAAGDSAVVGDSAVAPLAAVAGGAGVDEDSTKEAPPPSSPGSGTQGEGRARGERGAERAPPPGTGVILASDSLVAQLRALEGYVVTEYRAESARYDGTSGQLDLIGSPELERGGESMRADSLLSYDQRTSIICGYGKPVLSGTGNDPVESDQVCYDVDRQVGVALGAKTSFSQQGTWFVHGSELYTSGNDRLYGAATSFTTCDLDEPHYHFVAGEMKVVHDNVMVARNVTLRFGDVPVLWLPFLVQSLKPDRRSGLLTPSIGLQHVVRTSSGYRREIRDIGFYWAVSDHFGITSAMDWQSGEYIALRGDIQYRWLRQFLSGNISFRRYWQMGGITNFTLSGRSSWQPGERTSLDASVSYSSSGDLVRRYSADPDELNRSIDSNIGARHRFDWGSLNLSGSRRQHLTNDRVDLTFPSVSLNVNPITLFRASGDPRWYNNATWQNNMSFTARQTQVNIDLPSERGQGTATLQGSFNSQLTVGKLNWSGGFNFNENVNRARPTWYGPLTPDSVPGDSLVFHRSVNQTISWRTGLGFTQRLIENTTFTPNVSLSGGMRMRTDLPDSLDVHGHVMEPTRLNAGASLQTNIYGFWPGVGPYSRIRHRIEPSLNYTYSPTPTVTDLQRRAFGMDPDALRETNRLSVTINQTFEAKPKADVDGPAGEAEDTVTGAFGEVPPRRTQQVRPITLLSISTNALIYDFARAREGEYGLTTEQLSHSIHSDLLPGLRLNMGYDLWDSFGRRSEAESPRRFSPRLRSVTANFSLSSESWPFRLFRGSGAPEVQGGESGEAPSDPGDPDDEMELRGPLMPGRRDHLRSGFTGGQAVGTWRGDFIYSLTRPRAGTSGEDNQLLTARLSFQPTEKWSVSWNTGYLLNTKEFTEHYVALNRDLHRWRASFIFSKTQYQTFSFRFEVELLDNPDIKLDYDQRSLPPPPPQFH